MESGREGSAQHKDRDQHSEVRKRGGKEGKGEKKGGRKSTLSLKGQHLNCNRTRQNEHHLPTRGKSWLYHSTTREKLDFQSGACLKIPCSFQVTTDPRNDNQRIIIHYICDRSLHRILVLRTCKYLHCHRTNRITNYRPRISCPIVFYILDCRVVFFL